MLVVMALLQAFQAVAALATRGIPAIQSGLHGARIGAGARFAKSTVEQLGVKVAAPVAQAAGAVASTARAMTLGEGGISGGGVALRLTPTGGVAATVSEELVASAARTTVRGALGQIGRATALGALGGAAIDAVLAGVEVVPAVRKGTLARGVAARHVGKRAARGAAAGAAGVVAAGAVSAVVAAAGITIAGAPVVIPLAAMVAAGTLASRAFDRRFGAESPVAEPRAALTE